MKQVRDNYSEKKVTSGQHFCGKCGSLLSSRDSHCVQCHPRSKPQQVEQKHMQRPVEWKNETITLILSIILPGTGHIYIGQLVKGIGILAVDTVITVLFWFVEPLFFFAYFPLTIWACYDAYKLCKVYNNHIQQFGRPPKW
jgi:TM2 domain-containing membrane protein YozV